MRTRREGERRESRGSRRGAPAIRAAALGVFVGLVACTPTSPAPKEKTSVPTVPSPQGAPIAAPPRVLSIAPRDGAPTRLVVLLHGIGASAEALSDVARALAPALPQAELVTPDGFHPFDQGGPGRQWFSLLHVTEADRGRRVREAGVEVSLWIDHELDSRALAHDRLVVVGFSQGAAIAAWLAIHRSPAPAAVVMFSGRVVEDAVPVTGSTSTPVFMGHGTEDTVIPVTFLDPGARVLEAWGARVTKSVYPGLGHQIDPRELRDAEEFLTLALAHR